jgi:outer membrane PBP1 activator LpoA protein
MAARKGLASRPWRTWLLCTAIIASGCAGPQPAQDIPRTAALDPQTVAADHLAAGRFEAAVSAYATLAAGLTDPAATRARLKSILLRIDLREDAAAELPSAALADPSLESLRTLGVAAAALDAGDPGGALTRLEAMTQGAFDPYERGLYLRTLGRAQLASSLPLPAAQNLLAAESRPMPAGRRGELTHAIWDALGAAGSTEVSAGVPADAPHAAGWFALSAAYTANAFEPTAFAAALAGWQAQFPDHPAQDILIAELLEKTEDAANAPGKIALLLPLEGPLADIAASIRDGFVAMRFSGAVSPPPEILVYSVNASNVSAKLAEAVAAGADFAVGPLEKAALDALVAAGPPPVPTLALNTAGKAPAASGRLFQFGLRPEDEAIDAAERAWRDGHRRIIAMAPSNDFGWRVLSAFTAHWEALGGTVVEQVRFQSSVQAYAAAVRQTFGLRQSEARAAALRALLQRQLVFEARRRDDVDAIMLSAPPVEARQILPQFRYFGADDLPIYATSSVYGGVRNPAADQDLDGVMFGDSPWALDTGELALKRAFEAHWRGGSEQLGFFAFGADAFRIIPYLAQMRSQPGMRVSGATGRLYVDADGLVRRSLTWARFRGGVPRLLDTPAR